MFSRFSARLSVLELRFERTKAGRPLLTVPGACEASSDFSEMVTWPYRVSTGKPELLNTTDASGVPGGVVLAMMLLAGAAAEVGKFLFAYIFCLAPGAAGCESLLCRQKPKTVCAHI